MASRLGLKLSECGFDSHSPYHFKEVIMEHIERMKQELLSLESNISKLSQFMLTDLFESLSDKQKELMSLQREAMRAYSLVLSQRVDLEIDIFNSKQRLK